MKKQLLRNPSAFSGLALSLGAKKVFFVCFLYVLNVFLLVYVCFFLNKCVVFTVHFFVCSYVLVFFKK